MIRVLIAQLMGNQHSPTPPTRKERKVQAKWVDQQKLEDAKAKRKRKMQRNKRLVKTETNVITDAP